MPPRTLARRKSTGPAGQKASAGENFQAVSQRHPHPNDALPLPLPRKAHRGPGIRTGGGKRLDVAYAGAPNSPQRGGFGMNLPVLFRGLGGAMGAWLGDFLPFLYIRRTKRRPGEPPGGVAGVALRGGCLWHRKVL